MEGRWRQGTAVVHPLQHGGAMAGPLTIVSKMLSKNPSSTRKLIKMRGLRHLEETEMQIFSLLDQVREDEIAMEAAGVNIG